MFSSAVRRAAARGASRSVASVAVPPVNSMRFVPLPTQFSVGSAAQLRATAWRAFSAEAGGEKKDGSQKEKSDEVPLEDDIPLIGKLGLYLDASMKLAIAAAIMGGVLYFGYFIIRTLVPTSASPMTIRNDALAILQADPDLSSAFGEITRARGIDSGRGEGRRNYVPSYSYERSGKTFTRIKFQVDNASKRSATVFAEVAHDRSTSTDFNYLMVQMDRSKQVLTLVDNRKPEKSRDMRQYDVAVKLQHDGATFYSGGPLHDSTSEQMQILGPHMDYINTVRCDLNEGRCEADGYSAGTLVYRTKAHKAPLGLDDLEGMVGLDRYTRGNT